MSRALWIVAKGHPRNKQHTEIGTTRAVNECGTLSVTSTIGQPAVTGTGTTGTREVGWGKRWLG